VQQRYKLKEEKKLQQKIIDVIAPFVGGDDKVVAQVSVEFDFSQKSSTSEVYDPENVVRSEQVSEEKREGVAPEQVGGVPGTVSNIGPVKGLKSQKTVEKYTKNTGTTNYKHALDKEGNPTDALEYVPLDETDLKALTSLASRSVGIDAQRGDQISVQNLQFERAAVTTPDGVSQAVTFTQTYIAPFADLFKYIFVLILLLILYKKVIAPFADKMLEVSREDEEIEAPKLEFEDDEGEDLIEKVQTMRKKVEEQLGMTSNLNEDELKHEVILEKVRTMAEDIPEEIASLLQALLSEEAEIPKADNKG